MRSLHWYLANQISVRSHARTGLDVAVLLWLLAPPEGLVMVCLSRKQWRSSCRSKLLR